MRGRALVYVVSANGVAGGISVKTSSRGIIDERFIPREPIFMKAFFRIAICAANKW